MSLLKAGEPIDIDSDILNPGDPINVFNFLNNDWKNAVVREIDISEREVLVNYEDDSQEWISVDTRKLRFPPLESCKTPTSVRRRTSTIKVIENIESKPTASLGSKEHLNTSVKDPCDKSQKILKNDLPSKRNNSSSSKSKIRPSKLSEEKKVMNKASPFWRLKFKSHSQLEMTSRKRDKREHSRKSKAANEIETNSFSNIQNENSLPKMSIESKTVLKNRNFVNGTKKKRQDGERKEEERNVNSTDGLKRKVPSRKNSISSGELFIDKSDSLSKSAQCATSANKKIKTLLPKRATEVLPESPSSPNLSIPSTPDVITAAPVSLSSVSLTANVIPLAINPMASGLVCPKQDCKKQFRNENLLMMHIKHYHCEYRNMLKSMPNVADLAYARTVGESVDSPQSGFLEKIAKLEEDKLKEKNEDSIALIDESFDEKVNEDFTASLGVSEKSIDGFSKGRTIKKSLINNKRVADSSPSSPKLSALLTQLQEPPLISPSISIDPENNDSESSISHNAPPSAGSPKDISKSKICSDKSPVQSDLEDKCYDEKKSPTRKRRLSHLESTDVINCTCGYGFEDGLMIRCDLCLCWQHGACNSVENEEDVPSAYVCDPCLYPRRLHSSKKYFYVQNWIKDGTMPAFEFCEPQEEILKKRESYLKQSHEFLCRLTELRIAMRSLQVKLQILKQTPDHPKLYLWAKSWDEKSSKESENLLIAIDGPVPEAAINATDCRKNLSEHIDDEMIKVERQLLSLEEEIEKLNQNDDDEDTFGQNVEKDGCIAKQTLLMMMRDLSSIQNLKYC